MPLKRPFNIENAPPPFASTVEQVLGALGSGREGLSEKQAVERLADEGPNLLPQGRSRSLSMVFGGQFLNPLIYVLLAAAALSFALGRSSDGAFIVAVLLLNAAIGTAQEYRAERSAQALRKLAGRRARVRRAGHEREIDAETLVPGDWVLLDPGCQVPADIRLCRSAGLKMQEALLTGESESVQKNPNTVLDADCVVGDRVTMAFAGTLVERGHGEGVVVATGGDTQLGKIAESVLGRAQTKTPLLVRMEQFSRRLAGILVAITLVLGGIYLAQGQGMANTALLAIALAVSVIPEGLPVALTVALAVGSSRMAKRGVLVRRLPAVEALGSCTIIATDKTGTLTQNDMTASALWVPGGLVLRLDGGAEDPSGELSLDGKPPLRWMRAAALRLARAAVLSNDGAFFRRLGLWRRRGDPVDAALMVMAHKLGVTRQTVEKSLERLAYLPYESERGYSASLDHHLGESRISAKGSPEKIVAMCTHDAAGPLDGDWVRVKASDMAAEGYRVIAVGSSNPVDLKQVGLHDEDLHDMEFLGLVGLRDPLREEASSAYRQCVAGGIRVLMVTGDHPLTAAAVGRELGMGLERHQLVTGSQLLEAGEGPRFDALVEKGRIFSRIEPFQKLQIVESLQRAGHFVAVTGDGANDAPALKAAQVGVAMGKTGTDVSREVSDLILTDDRFSSLVEGVKEGRIAYSNVRKVIYLLIATGAAEVFLFVASVLAGLPIPLTAVQLLWLNLVTNGIQDVALAFEPGEGSEIRQRPRPPKEPVFNRLMIAEVVLSSLVMGMVGFAMYAWWLKGGMPVAEARNLLLLQMVLFENIMIGAVRSETRSSLTINPFSNRFLFFGAVAAHTVHLAATQIPGLGSLLQVGSVGLREWSLLAATATSVFWVMELFKWAWRSIPQLRAGPQNSGREGSPVFHGSIRH